MANLGYPAIKGWLVNILIHNNPKIKDYISTMQLVDTGYNYRVIGYIWIGLTTLLVDMSLIYHPIKYLLEESNGF